MKKALSLVLALVLALSLSVCAFAATANDGTLEDTTTDSEGQAVTVTVKGLTPSGTVYHVVVEWPASLTFTYNEGTQGAWQPNSHDYDATTGEGWENSTATIKVTNHSNAAVTVAAAATDASDADGVSVDVATTGNQTLATGEGRTYGEAASVEYTVTVSGKPTASLAEDGKVATITITITAASGT